MAAFDSRAADFHLTSDTAGESADARSEAIADRAAELTADDAEVLSALGSLDSADYDELDTLMVAAFRSDDWAAYTARMRSLVAAQLRRTAASQIDGGRA